MRVLTSLDDPDLGRLRAAGEFFWLDLQSPDVEQLGRLFGFARMALEDTEEFGQRPKLDDYGDHVLLVFYGMDGEELVEVHTYISGDAVVTVRHGHCRSLLHARERLQRRAMASEEEAVYRVLDTLTDSYLPWLDNLEAELDALDEQIEDGIEPAQRRRVFTLRRQVAHIGRVVVPQRDVFTHGGGTLEGVPGFDVDRAHDYLRDVHDHLQSIAGRLDADRDAANGLLDRYTAAESTRANLVQERLTRVATIFLPLTFVTGFFGQNFGWMIDHVAHFWEFLVLGVGGCVGSAAALGAWIRRSHALK